MRNSFWLFNGLSVVALLMLGACSDAPINTTPSLVLGPYQIVVQFGDTLYGIALRYKVSLKALMKLNRLTSSHIQVGQVLLLPSSTEKDSEASVPSTMGTQEQVQVTPLTPLRPPPYTPLNAPGALRIEAGIDQEIAAEQSPEQSAGAPLGIGTTATGVVGGGTAAAGTALSVGAGASASISSVSGGGASKEAASTGGAEVADMMKNKAVSSTASSLNWPVQGNVVKQFSAMAGKRFDGVEIESQAGNSVAAAQEGTVAICKDNYQFLGNIVVVKGADGTLTAYGHLAKIAVKPQQAIKPGTVIGTVGQKNKIYFEYRKAAKPGDPLKPVNPLKFLSGKAS